jgi:hypothetical protein
MMSARRRRPAAGASILAGLGFGVPGLVGIVHLANTGKVWTFLGFPTYGGGPLESLGIRTTIPLMAGYLVVCVAEVGAGVLLWTNRPAGPWSTWVLLPFETAYWIGFALPFGLLLGVARTILVGVPKAQATNPGPLR